MASEGMNIGIKTSQKTAGENENEARPRQRCRLVGLEPIVAPDARLAILGSFPGAASLAARQYYAFSRNGFWPIVGTLLGDSSLRERAYEERLVFLKKHQLALWDVYGACRREGSLDSAIEQGEPNDLARLLRVAPGLKLFAHNGGASGKFMRVVRALGVETIQLPSTSPANASWSFERKLAAWRAAFAQAGVL